MYLIESNPIIEVVLLALAAIIIYWFYIDYVERTQLSTTQSTSNYKNPDKNIKVSNNSRPNREQKSTGIATVLSFFIPGLGQIYNGQILKGVLFLIMIPLIIVIGVVIMATNTHQTCNWWGCSPSLDPSSIGIGFLVIIIFVPIFWIYNLYDAYNTAKRTWEE